MGMAADLWNYFETPPVMFIVDDLISETPYRAGSVIPPTIIIKIPIKIFF